MNYSKLSTAAFLIFKCYNENVTVQISSFDLFKKILVGDKLLAALLIRQFSSSSSSFFEGMFSKLVTCMCM